MFDQSRDELPQHQRVIVIVKNVWASYLLRQTVSLTAPKQLRPIHHVRGDGDVEIVVGIDTGAYEDEFAARRDGFVARFY